MKYMAIGKRNLVPMEPRMAVGVLQASLEELKASLADGTLDVAYMHIDGSTGFSIVNADSHEEAMDVLLAHPAFVFMDWEVVPLVDLSHAYEVLIKLHQKMSG